MAVKGGSRGRERTQIVGSAGSFYAMAERGLIAEFHVLVRRKLGLGCRWRPPAPQSPILLQTMVNVRPSSFPTLQCGTALSAHLRAKVVQYSHGVLVFFKPIAFLLQYLSHFLLGFFLSFLLLSFLLGLMKTSILLEELINKNHLAGMSREWCYFVRLNWFFAKPTSHVPPPSFTASSSDVRKWFSNDKWLNLPIMREFWENGSAGRAYFFF